MVKTPASRKVVIPSVLAEAASVQQAILVKVKEAGFSENAQFAIRLALDEALANAIHHGNCDDPKKKVTIDYHVEQDRVQVTICDEGCGFAPEALPDCTEQENLNRPSGRGVLLIKSFMTEVKFNKCGNCITMIKRRDCDQPVRKHAV